MAGELLARYLMSKLEKQEHKEEQQQKDVLKNSIVETPTFLNAETIYNNSIKPTIKTDKFYALSLVGPQGKGKTKLSCKFATLAKEDGFAVVYLKAEDLYEHLEELKPKIKHRMRLANTTKLLVVMDDMSYSNESVNRKQSSVFKHFIADIRHVFKASVFLIFISHRYHSVPPMLRNSASWIFTSMQSADRDDAMKLIPKRKAILEHLDKLYLWLAKVSDIGARKGKVQLIGKNGQPYDFVWGTEENYGDGRLMVSFHAGELFLFNSKLTDNVIELDSKEYKINYNSVDVDPELEEIKEIENKEFEEIAEQLFPIKNAV